MVRWNPNPSAGLPGTTQYIRGIASTAEVQLARNSSTLGRYGCQHRSYCPTGTSTEVCRHRNMGCGCRRITRDRLTLVCCSGCISRMEVAGQRGSKAKHAINTGTLVHYYASASILARLQVVLVLVLVHTKLNVETTMLGVELCANRVTGTYSFSFFYSCTA
jgi:hypothetical protein